MKRVACIIGVLLGMTCAEAQDSIPMHAIENILTFGIGKTYTTDEYLSSLPYSGLSFNLDNAWWQNFRNHPNWSHVGEVRLTGALLGNQPNSNSIIGFGIRGGWGAHYNYHPIENLTLLAGACIEGDYFGRVISKSVNKPYSMDLSLTANVSVGIAYQFQGKNSAYRLRYLIRTPFAGCMFIPEMGESYYEMESSLRGTTHFASFHNRFALLHELTLDMRFKQSTWRVGVEHDFQRVSANNLMANREQVRIVIGTIFNYTTFGGKNRLNSIEHYW